MNAWHGNTAALAVAIEIEPWPPPDSKTPLARGVVQIEKTYGTSANDNADAENAQVLRKRLPQFTSRRRFCVWAVLAGFAPPERLTERILAELEGAS